MSTDSIMIAGERSRNPVTSRSPATSSKGKLPIESVTKVLGAGKQKVFSVWDDFQSFIDRGNVVDLAVGIIMGSALTGVVNSMVKDMIGPIIGLAVGDSLENSFVIMRCPKDVPSPCSFPSLKLASDAGAVTFNWGNFFQTVINFVIISVIVFFLVKAYTAAFRRSPAEKTKKTCVYCYNDIPLKAQRCGFCTSALEYEN